MNNNFIEGESPVDNLKHLLIIMRITFCFLFLGILLAQAAPGYSQETELNIDLKTASIQEILAEIESESNFRFIFDSNARKIIGKRVTLSDNTHKIEDILDEILTATGLTYKILDDQVVIYQNEVMQATKEIAKTITQIEQQKKRISGNITDQAGEAKAGRGLKLF
jgi:deoxyribodipyrimidine photolyase